MIHLSARAGQATRAAGSWLSAAFLMATLFLIYAAPTAVGHRLGPLRHRHVRLRVTQHLLRSIAAYGVVYAAFLLLDGQPIRLILAVLTVTVAAVVADHIATPWPPDARPPGPRRRGWVAMDRDTTPAAFGDTGDVAARYPATVNPDHGGGDR